MRCSRSYEPKIPYVTLTKLDVKTFQFFFFNLSLHENELGQPDGTLRLMRVLTI